MQLMVSILRSNAGMVRLTLEVDVMDQLDSGLKFLLGSPQRVPDGHRRVLSSVWVGRFLQNVLII